MTNGEGQLNPGPTFSSLLRIDAATTVIAMAAVKIPTEVEIRKLLEEKRQRADKTARSIKEATDAAAKKSDELILLEKKLLDAEAALEKNRVEIGKLKDRKKLDPSEARGVLDAVIKKYACEPVEELIRMVTERVPMLDREGREVVGPNGEVQTRFALDPELRSSILLKLVEFRMPRLRGTEVSGKIDVDHKVYVVRYGDTEMKPAQIIET